MEDLYGWVPGLGNETVSSEGSYWCLYYLETITLVIWEKHAEMTHPKLSNSDQSSRRYENRIGMFVRGRTLQLYEGGSVIPWDKSFISSVFSIFSSGGGASSKRKPKDQA